MALTIGTSGSLGNSFSGAVLTLTGFTVSSGTDCVIALIGAGNNTLGTRTVSTVTWNGASLTRLGSAAADDGNFLRTDVFYLFAPTPATGDCVVTFGGSNLEAFVSLTNVQGLTLLSQFATPVLNSSTSNNSPTATVSSAAGEYVFGVVASDANATITETGTLIGEAQALNSDVCCGSQYFSGSASVGVAWSASTPDNGWAVTGFAVQPVAAAVLWAQTLL